MIDSRVGASLALVQNGLPPKLMILNKKTSAVEVEHALPAESLTDPKTVHPQFRRGRVTAKNLGPATSAQFLDQPGIPERPGDVQH